MDTLDQKLLDEIGSFFPSDTLEYLDAPAVKAAHDALKEKTEEYYNLRKEHNGDPGDDAGIARLRDEIVGLQGKLIEAIAVEKERREKAPPPRRAGGRSLKLPALDDAMLSKVALGVSGLAIVAALALGYLNHQSQAQGRRDTEKKLAGKIDDSIGKAIQRAVGESSGRMESQLQAIQADRQAGEKKLQERLDAMEAQVKELRDQVTKLAAAPAGGKKKAGKRR